MVLGSVAPADRRYQTQVLASQNAYRAEYPPCEAFMRLISGALLRCDRYYNIQGMASSDWPTLSGDALKLLLLPHVLHVGLDGIA